MVLTQQQIAHIDFAAKVFLVKRRPPEHLRDQIDLAYRIVDQSVFIYEVRPMWNNPSEIMEAEVAKATYVKTENVWKVYWMRANLKWDAYSPNPTVRTINEFFDIVDSDDNACFFG